MKTSTLCFGSGGTLRTTNCTRSVLERSIPIPAHVPEEISRQPLIKGRESGGEATGCSSSSSTVSLSLSLSLSCSSSVPSALLDTSPTMSGPHPPLPPPFAFLDTAGGLGGGGGDDDNPRRRHLPSTHAVEANPVFPDEDDPNTNHGEYSDLASAAPCRCPACGKRFSHHHMWQVITPPVSEKELAAAAAAALLGRLSSGEGARAKRYMCSWCGKVFETRQGLGGHRKNQYKSVNRCQARSLVGRKGSGVHGERNVSRGSGDEGGKQMRIGQKRSGAGRWKASKEAETAEAAAERRGLLPDLNLPVPAPEDTEDGSSSGIIDLNKKLPGQDGE